MKGWACIARLGGVGDNLVAASALRPLKRMGYMTEVITSEFAADVYRNNPFLDKLSIKGEKDIPPGDAWWEWFNSRGKEYEVFANLSFSMESRHSWHRNTAPFWWNEDYRRKVCAGSFIETAHDVVGVPHEFGPLFFPTEEERERAEETKQRVCGGPYVAWIISGSRVDKMHPYTGLAIARIIRELDIPVMMIGSGPKQFEYAKKTQVHVKRVNSTDDGLSLALQPDDGKIGDKWGAENKVEWPIRRSLAQTLAAGLVIGPETGPMWAAAFESVPKICMVSHASVDNITKHWVNCTTLHADPARVPCWPCHRLHDDLSTCTTDSTGEWSACMEDIKVETIMEHVERLFRRTNVVPLREAAE